MSSEIRIKAAKEILDLFNPEYVYPILLDIGCGVGHLVEVARQRKFLAWGIDSKETKFISDFCSTVDFNSLETTYPYDLITLNHTFEHLVNPKETLEHIRKIILPSSYIVIVVPNIDSPFALSKKWYGWGNGEGGHEFMYSPRTLKFLLERNGFEVIKLKTGTMHHNFPVNIFSKLLALIGKGDNLIVVARLK